MSEETPDINISEHKEQEDEDNDNRRGNEFKVPLPAKDKREIELEQEAKLKAKYGGLKKPGGGSALLQKRLQKGQKYFDSGDYNMAKAKMNNPKHPLPAKEKLFLQESIGGVIPTPEAVEQTRKPSITTSKLLMQEEGGEKLDFQQRRGGVFDVIH